VANVDEITIAEIARMSPLQHRVDFEQESVQQRIFPCLSDEEALLALRNLIGSPKVQVEVVGGILRHSIR